MRLLLDSHVLLWWLFDGARLTSSAHTMIFADRRLGEDDVELYRLYPAVSRQERLSLT